MSKNNSMINPSIVDLLKRVDNRYSLVVATSRRARQIIDGQEPQVDDKDGKPLTIAINEVNEGVISVEEKEDSVVDNEFDIIEETEVLSEIETTEDLEEIEELELPSSIEGVEEGLV